MGQKKKVKDRKCSRCGEKIAATAAGIKAHANTCKGKNATTGGK